MISKLSVFSLALMFCAKTINSQVSNYTFSQSIGAYGAPNTGTLIGPPMQDEDVTPVTLPFTFTFNGTAYTTASVCSNGNISFAPITGSEWTPLSDNTTQEVISVYGADLGGGIVTFGTMTAGSNTIASCSSVAGYSVGDIIFDWNSDFGGITPTITAIVGNDIILSTNANNSDPFYTLIDQGSIRMDVSGTAPNRICEIEYRNFSRFNIDEVMNFKIKLYETTNKIEFVYGAMISAPFGGDPGEIGLKGLSQLDFNSRTVTSPNVWSTSSAASSITDYCDFDGSLAPSNGQTYAWTPVNCVTPTLAIAQSTLFSCPGEPVTLTASGALSYTWTNGPSTPQHTVNPLVTTTYTLVGANSECTSTTTITHSIIASPVIGVVQSSSLNCAGATVTLTASGATSYTWTNGPTTSQHTINPTTTTTYTVSGSNGGVCNGIALVTQSVIPNPALGIVQSSTSICPGQTAVLTATGATGYSWSNGLTTASISVSPTITTNYTVTGNNAQCAATLSVAQTVDACLGIKDNSIANNVSVYPNPFRNELNISNSGSGEMVITIADALGKTVYMTTISENASQTIQTSALANGLYFINIGDKNSSVTKKLVKN